MAASNSHFHVRSNSLPSQSNPLLLQCNENLSRLEARGATSSSSFITQRLSGLEDLHECVEKLLLLPSTQQAFVQGRQEQWIDQLVDGSLRLLDLCSSAKDAVLHTKECARDIQSIMRRRRGAEVGLESEISKYLASRKVVKRAINKALGSLKSVETKSSFSDLSNKDGETIALISVLKEVEVVALAVFESLLSFISGPKAQTKLGGWSLVSKIMHSKRVGCEEEQQVNEFAKVDAAMHRLMSHKMQIEKVQSELQILEMCVQDFEERLECLFRRLIKTRVSLLNILNN